MKLLVCAVFLVAIAVASAYDGTVYMSQLPYYKMQRGIKSTGDDDSPSEARCDNYYQIVNCSCTPRDNCDGALQFSDVNGLKCIAFNKAGKPFGVDAFAHCVRVLINVESKTMTDPVASCPSEYRIISCQLHSYKQNLHPSCRAIPKNGKCVVSGWGCRPGDCTECRMEARCIRNTNWYGAFGI